MRLPSEGRLLRIYVGEHDRYEGRPLHEWILLKAREEGLAGATVFRGQAGFGAKSHLHTAKILRLSSDLPVMIEIVDTAAKIESFLAIADEAIDDGLATVERVEIRIHRSDPAAGA